MRARDRLYQLFSKVAHRYPIIWVFGVWQELNWRWWEELKVEFRSLMREMQTETPTKEELKFYALSPAEDCNARF